MKRTLKVQIALSDTVHHEDIRRSPRHRCSVGHHHDDHYSSSRIPKPLALLQEQAYESVPLFLLHLPC